MYIAGIDLAGEAEGQGDGITQNSTAVLSSRAATRDPDVLAFKFNNSHSRDSTVVTIAELVPTSDLLTNAPSIRIIEHYRWTGRKHAGLYVQLVDILKNVWHCKRVVVDATGVGQPVASFLKEALGSAVVPFTFTQPAKSELGFNLLAAIDSGRLKTYAADGSAEYREFWKEMEKAKSHYRASRTMNFYVDPNQGHDDFLMSLALAVEAGREYSPRRAKGRSGE